MPSSQFIFPEVPNDQNIHGFLKNIYQNYNAVEQVRWNESDIDSRFHAGDQQYIYNYFQFQPQYNAQQFHFNIIQQPCNMITGYQRQHRKSLSFQPAESSDQKTADQFTTLLRYVNNKRRILEKFSEACEQSMVTGMCLMQPYLDFTHDPVNGQMDMKIWAYNSFMMDPFWREPDMSDANWVWIQKYISKNEALAAFPEYADQIRSMTGYRNRDGKFYFLPENYNIAKANLLVLSYFWYKDVAKRERLYNKNTGEITSFMDDPEAIEQYLKVFPQFEKITVEVPTWKVAVVLNETKLYMGDNPLGFDECPFVPVYWNYDPNIAQYNLRTRSLVRTLRDAQFLYNRRIILNHDIAESSLNSGWIARENSIVDEDSLSKTGQGSNIWVKEEQEGKPLSEIAQKIVPQAVPASDLQMADQLLQVLPALSGVNQELMGMASDAKAGITELLRQGAGLVTLQKYFDQWDLALKLLGNKQMKIIQRNWTSFKVQRILNEVPTEQFFTKNFQEYDVLTVEGMDTAVQKQQAYAQALEFQSQTGIQLPPQYILNLAQFQNKDELMQLMEQQQAQQSEMQNQQAQTELALLEQKLQNLQADTAEKLAMAKERVGRTKSNVGLFEERLSEVSQNQSRAVREKISALKDLIEILNQYGETETMKSQRALNLVEEDMEDEEKINKLRARGDAIQDETSQGVLRGKL